MSYDAAMDNLANSLSYIVAQTKHNLSMVLGILAILWLFNIFNWFTGSHLNNLGIRPRRMSGLIGIIFSPILHGNFNHLFFNSIPLFVLMNFMLFEGVEKFYCASAMIILLSGFGTWLFGRRAIHIGASGVLMGYWGYLIVHAFHKPTMYSIILALITLYYFAGLYINLFPGKKSVSWEGHVIGFFAGLATIYLCPLQAFLNNIL